MQNLEPHYKLKLPDSRFLETVWERTDKTPNYAYIPFNGEYAFKHCNAKTKEIVDYRNWSLDRKDQLKIWKLECFESIAALSLSNQPDYLSGGWRSGCAVSVAINDDIIVLSSDAEGVDEILLIEKRFLDPVKPNFIENKFNIPIKPCRIKAKSVTPFGGGEERTYYLCEIHNYDVAEGATACELAIPREYLPCDIESDQGGTRCETHGGWVEYEDYCKDYKGPTKTSTDDYGQEEKVIPEGYQTCGFNWHSNGIDWHLHSPSAITYDTECYTHENGIREPDKKYCDKYDGPLRILR